MMKKWFPVMSLLAFSGIAGLMLGCQSSEPSDGISQSQAASAAVTEHKVTKAEVGQEAFCPVMKTHFKIGADTIASEYKGRVYYFCCPGCPGAFKSDPERYLK